MRRWLSLLLLLMLPFQFTWAAAAAYCQHETSSDARHVGHHEHEHKTTSLEAHAKSSVQDAAEAGKLVSDNDCGYCQLSAAKPLQMQAFTLVALTGHSVHNATVHPLLTRDPERYERPNWCLA